MINWIKQLIACIMYFPEPPPPPKPTCADRMARVVEILENTYGQDCGDVASIDQAIDILKGGYFPPKTTEASQ